MSIASTLDHLGRPRNLFSLWHLIPFWAWFFLILAFNYQQLRAPLLRDLSLLLHKWTWILMIPVTVFGFPNLVGRAPKSELALNWELPYNIIGILATTLLGVIPSILAWIPGEWGSSFLFPWSLVVCLT